MGPKLITFIYDSAMNMQERLTAQDSDTEM